MEARSDGRDFGLRGDHGGLLNGAIKVEKE